MLRELDRNEEAELSEHLNHTLLCRSFMLYRDKSSTKSGRVANQEALLFWNSNVILSVLRLTEV